MCGIIGIVSDRASGAREVLLTGLQRLEYRGYDSAGIALVGEATAVYKTAGRVKDLRTKVPEGADAGSGIAHTRWATHGGITDANAHPHKDDQGRVVVVHNGIIENFNEIKERLAAKGRKFVSQTDTEVFAHLFAEELKQERVVDADTAEGAFRRALRQLRGAYAIAATVAGVPDVIFGARKEAPLLAGHSNGCSFLASDVTAVVEYTKDVVYLEEGDVVVATPRGYEITDLDGAPVKRTTHHITWDIEEAQKGGYDHFMLKEMFDGPRAVAEALTGRIHPTPPHVRLDWGLPGAAVRLTRRIMILACGTSYHSGLVAKHIIETLSGIPVDVQNASEYRYGPQVKENPLLVLAISQSGETVDTLGAMREARKRGHTVVALTNVVGSTIAREADGVLYIHAGPEIGVAATKSFLSQLACLYLIGLHLAELHGTRNAADLRALASGLQHVPRLVQQVLSRSDAIRAAADRISDVYSCFYLGRQALYPVALEGALKLKEISYIHAEGYAGGELKHGPFALLTQETPIIALLAPDPVYEKMLSNMIEVKARGPEVYAFTTDSDHEAENIADVVVRMPDCDPLFIPVVHSAALHLFSYWVAAKRGCEIDKPRNLAKSVTVE